MPLCCLAWTGARSLGAGGPRTWTLWAPGEEGRTTREKALLSTTKAAVGSEKGHNDDGGADDGDDDDYIADRNDSKNCEGDDWNSLFCVCCCKAESFPSLETRAAAASGCC